MISKEEILNKTNGGLDIIKKIYPQVKLNGKFKLRDESEASASIKRDERGIYWIKDFGDGGKAMDAFNLIETKYNCDFKGAVEICAKELNIETNTKIPKETELYFNGKKLIKKEFTKEELNYFGKNITETDLQKFDISSLKAYEGLKSSLKYFIFFYGPFGSLAKINKPQDTSSRFFYLGTKSIEYIFGLKLLPPFVNDLIIAAGEKDVVNLHKHGYSAVCFSSETATIYDKQMSLLKARSNNIYLCYDIDDAGKSNAQKIKSTYPFVHIITLPEDLKKKSDFRGKPCADVADYFRYYTKEDFEKLIDEAKFYDIQISNSTSNIFWVNAKDIAINLTKLYSFISNLGIYKYKNQDVEFVKINFKIVTPIDTDYIKDAVINFAIRQNNPKLLEKLYSGRRSHFDQSSFENIHKKRELNFYKGEPESQCFFFEGKVWEISKERITIKSYSNLNFYVWEEQIIDFLPILEADYYQVELIDGKYTFLLNDTNCDFLRFVINTSNINKEDATTFNDDLSRHILSKITAIGYLLHTYYSGSLRKAIVATDAKERNKDQEEGGTGKSLLGQALKEIVPVFYRGSRKKNLFEDKHLLAGMTTRQKLLFFDDVTSKFDLSSLYTLITGQTEVEHKFINSYALKKEDSPKIYLTTNFSLLGNGSSHDRRIFEIAFSDYYNIKFNPRQDFGYEFFCKEMPYEQWNKFYNFMAQAVRTYLQFGLIEAPKENIRKNQLRCLIKEEFLNWAEESINLDNDIKNYIRNDFNDSFLKSLSDIEKRKFSSFSIKKNLKLFCELKSYDFNPSANGNDIKKNSIEYFEISKLGRSKT